MDEKPLSQEYVFYPKGRSVWIVLSLFFLIGGIGFIWSEFLYILVDDPSNLSNYPISEWLWRSTDNLDMWHYYFRMVCNFPIMIFLCVYDLLLIIHTVFFTKLIINQEAIEYQAPGYCVRARWSDIEKIDKKRIGFRSKEGLFLQSYVYTRNWAWFPVLLTEKEKKFIPLSDFKSVPLQSSLEEIVKQNMHYQNEHES